MQERQEIVVRPTTFPLSYRSSRLLISKYKPSLRVEFACVVAPERGVSVDGPGRYHDGRALWDELIADGGVADGDADGDGDRGEEAEDFAAYGVEVW